MKILLLLLLSNVFIINNSNKHDIISAAIEEKHIGFSVINRTTEKYDVCYYINKEFFCQKIESALTNQSDWFEINCDNPISTNKVIKISDIKYIKFASSPTKINDILISKRGKKIKCAILFYSNNVFKIATSKYKARSVSRKKIDKIYFNCSSFREIKKKNPKKITYNWFEMPFDHSVYSSCSVKSLNTILKKRDTAGKIVRLSFNKIQRVNSEELVCQISTDRKGKEVGKTKRHSKEFKHFERKIKKEQKKNKNISQLPQRLIFSTTLDCSVLFPKEVLKSSIKINDYSTSFKNKNNNIYILVLQTNILVALGNVKTPSDFLWE